jgi:hypothetical protein
LTRCYHVTRVMSGETGNLVVKVDVKENVEEGPMMTNIEFLKAWISSGKANLVSGKANQVTGCPRRVRVTQSHPSRTKVT